jgi:hypothetical protein
VPRPFLLAVLADDSGQARMNGRDPKTEPALLPKDPGGPQPRAALQAQLGLENGNRLQEINVHPSTRSSGAMMSLTGRSTRNHRMSVPGHEGLPVSRPVGRVLSPGFPCPGSSPLNGD